MQSTMMRMPLSAQSCARARRDAVSRVRDRLALARRDADDPSRFSDDGWLRTGDVGTVDAHGYVRITDRTKDLIKSGGEWISSVELESALMAHPAVAEAAVIAIAHEKWGERPLACVVLKEGRQATPEELNALLAGHFAKWQLPDRQVLEGEAAQPLPLAQASATAGR